MLMPSALAALRFRNSSTFVLCWTGRSAGFSPSRIYEAMSICNARPAVHQAECAYGWFGSGGSAASITCHEPPGGRCQKPDHPHTRTAAGALA